MRSAEFSSSKETEIWPHEGRSLHYLDMQVNNGPCPRHNSSLSQILLEAGAQQELPGVGRVGLVDLQCREVQVRLGEK